MAENIHQCFFVGINQAAGCLSLLRVLSFVQSVNLRASQTHHPLVKNEKRLNAGACRHDAVADTDREEEEEEDGRFVR